MLFRNYLWLWMMLFVVPDFAHTKRDPREKLTYLETPEKIFHGCLTYKHCYSPEDFAAPEDSNCVETADCCNHLIAIGGSDKDTNTNDQVVIEMYARSKAWISIGFSEDAQMGNDYVISCLRPNLTRVIGNIIVPEDTIPVVRNSWNIGPPQHEMRGNKNITDMSNIVVLETLVTVQAMYCKYYVNKKFTKENPDPGQPQIKIDLDKEYCILTAWSDHYREENNKDALDGHSADRNAGGKRPCLNPFIAGKRRQPTKEQRKLMKYHGMCMISAWVFFVGVSNFVGTFFKDIFKGLKFCRMRLWILLHCIFLLFAVALIALGTFFQLLAGYDWERQTHQDRLHLYGGYGVTLMFMVNFLSGMLTGAMKCRKKTSPDENKKSRVTFFHKILSHGTFIAAMLVIAESAELQFSGVSCHFAFVTLGFLILYWFLNMVMEFHKFWGPFLATPIEDPNDPADAFRMLTENTHDPNTAKGTIRLKTFTLVLFGCIMALMTVSLICMIVWPPEKPCYSQESHDFLERKAIAKYQKVKVSKQTEDL